MCEHWEKMEELSEVEQLVVQLADLAIQTVQMQEDYHRFRNLHSNHRICKGVKAESIIKELDTIQQSLLVITKHIL